MRFLRWVGRLRVAAGADREAGNAILEYVGLSVVLLVPFVYFLLSVFAVQRASFGVTQAAREAGRVLATADTVPDGLLRAQQAAELALRDQGDTQPVTIAVVPTGASCDGARGAAAASLAAGARYVVCVSSAVPLPYTDKGLFHLTGPPTISLRASAVVSVDTYRESG